MSTKLKKGQYIAVTLYNGPSPIKAEEVYNMLKDCNKNDLGMPVPDSTFSMKIDEFCRTVSEDLLSGNSIYKVKMKGVLI